MEKGQYLLAIHPRPTRSHSKVSSKQSPSSIWRLKQHLDQSYEEQKTIIISNNSQVIPSSSDQHSTSILQSHIHPKSSKLQSYDQLFLSKKWKMRESTGNTGNTYQKERKRMASYEIGWKGRQLYRYISRQKQRVKQMRNERMRLLREIEGQLDNQQNGYRSKKSFEQCSCSNKNRTKSNTVKQYAPKPMFVRQPILVQSMQELAESQTTVVKDQPPKSKMMSKVLNFKNHLKIKRQNREKAEEDQWYYLPKQLLPTESNSEGGINSNKQNPQSQKSSEDFAKMFENLLSECSGQFVGIQSRIQANFTFGELERSKMKEQLELMQRHMKRVSIEVEEKENQDIWCKKYPEVSQ